MYLPPLLPIYVDFLMADLVFVFVDYSTMVTEVLEHFYNSPDHFGIVV